MLLPALKRAREQGKRGVCLNNTKSLGLGWLLYCDEHDGRTPWPWAHEVGADIHRGRASWWKYLLVVLISVIVLGGFLAFALLFVGGAENDAPGPGPGPDPGEAQADSIIPGVPIALAVIALAGIVWTRWRRRRRVRGQAADRIAEGVADAGP